MPKPALFFSYGMTKSASTLAFHLTRGAMEHAGLAQPLARVSAVGPDRKINFVTHVDDRQMDELLAAADRLGHMLVLKTHTRPDPSVVRAVEDGRAIAHAIYRDPRDAALSMLDHGAQARARGHSGFAEIETLDDAIVGLRGQSDTLTAWLQLPGVVPLRYDDLAFNTVPTTEAIAAQLGVTIDAEAVARAVLRTQFIQFNKGIPDRYRTEMSEADSTRIRDIFAPFYQHLIDKPPQAPGPDSPVLPLGTLLHQPAQQTT